MTNLNAQIAAEIENREAARAACGNRGIAFNALADAEFEAVCADKRAYYEGKAATVNSDAARAKWLALAEVWA